MVARSRVRGVFAANEAHRAASGAPILAGKHLANDFAAHAEWAAQAATALAAYARELGATAPADSGDPSAPYNQGLRDAFEKMLSPDFERARRSTGYDQAEWRDYAAGLTAEAQRIATGAAEMSAPHQPGETRREAHGAMTFATSAQDEQSRPDKGTQIPPADAEEERMILAVSAGVDFAKQQLGLGSERDDDLADVIARAIETAWRRPGQPHTWPQFIAEHYNARPGTPDDPATWWDFAAAETDASHSETELDRADREQESGDIESRAAEAMTAEPSLAAAGPVDDFQRGLASCGHPANQDGECRCASWPERDLSAAAGPTAGQAFTGQAGARLPADHAGRPAGTTTSPATQTRPRRPR